MKSLLSTRAPGAPARSSRRSGCAGLVGQAGAGPLHQEVRSSSKNAGRDACQADQYGEYSRNGGGGKVDKNRQSPAWQEQNVARRYAPGHRVVAEVGSQACRWPGSTTAGALGVGRSTAAALLERLHGFSGGRRRALMTVLSGDPAARRILSRPAPSQVAGSSGGMTSCLLELTITRFSGSVDVPELAAIFAMIVSFSGSASGAACLDGTTTNCSFAGERHAA